MSRRPDIAEVVGMLADRMPELARELCGEPTQRNRDEQRYRRRGSLSVIISGPKRGSWYDHEAGCGGDALGLVAHMRGCEMRGACGWALSWLGVAGNHAPAPRQHRPVEPSKTAMEASSTLELARSIWGGAQPAVGSVVATYLASRGLILPTDAPIRFHPSCQRGAERLPAMVALMTAPQSGEPVGVHRTFLRHDGSGKAEGTAKMMAGNAGVIRLSGVTGQQGRLGLAEGIETSLSVLQRGGWGPVWAATSAGGISAFPVLEGIEELHLFADADEAGLKAARNCGRRWATAGRRARAIWPPAGDWNDALRHTNERAA
jgi:hypothetical protein